MDYLVALVKERWPTYGPDRVQFELANAFGVRVSRCTVDRSLRRLRPPAPAAPAKEAPAWRFYEKERPHVLWHGDLHLGTRLPDGTAVWAADVQDDCSRGIVGEEIVTTSDARAVVRALIGAMCAWRVVPVLLEMDNGSECKNRLLDAFCAAVGIHLFHTTPYHPQSNGKQERSFRSAQEEFWRSLDTTDLDEIRRRRRDFLLRWNDERGQQALGGLPPCSRLVPGDRRDLDDARLAELARAPLGQRVVDAEGWIAYLGRRVRVGRRFARERVDLVLTLEDAEVLLRGEAIGRFDYWSHAKDYAKSRGE
ncbi:MAG: DDE-type integrase/transposase/recombinase [Candidatus Thermoplasmatota archaeon]